MLVDPGYISPRYGERRQLERRLLPDDDMRTELIVSKHALPLRRLFQGQRHIRQISDDPLVLVELQLLSPIRSPPAQRSRTCLFPFVKAVLQNLLEAAFTETAKILRTGTTDRMECITNRQNDRVPIYVECDAAQLFERPGGGQGSNQTKLLEHLVGPVEEPLPPRR